MCKPMGKFAENLDLGKHVLPPPLTPGHFHMKVVHPLNQYVAQRVCDFQIELHNMPIHLKISLPCIVLVVNLPQWGVLTIPGIALKNWHVCATLISAFILYSPHFNCVSEKDGKPNASMFLFLPPPPVEFC